MKRLFWTLIVGCVFLALPGYASADPTFGGGLMTPVAVPEIDAAGAMTALGVLAGVVALFTERFRRK